MTHPAGYEVRAPAPEDLDAVGALFAADDLDDAGQPVLDAGFVQDEWSRPGFDLATDAWVVVDRAGRISAYGEAVREGRDIVKALGVVHPEHRGQGIGSSLLDRIEERAAALAAGLPSPRLRHAINAGDEAAAAMLRARGFRLVRHFSHMRIDLAPPLEPGAAPPGIEIREPGADIAAVHTVLAEAFADDWDYHPEPFERWAEEHARSPSHDPTLWLLARDGGEPVGALTANAWGTDGWVVELGVLPSHRGRGIGEALLRHALATFAARGLRRALVSVDAANPTGATALYERVGMRVVKRWDLWELESHDRKPARVQRIA